MKNRKFLLSFIALVLMSVAAISAEEPLKIDLVVNNGALTNSAGAPGGAPADDNAIRVTVQFTNLKAGRIKVLKVAGTFFDADGKELAKDQAPPLEVGSRDTASTTLYFANPARLVAFKMTGTVEYQKDGEIITAPIATDQTKPIDPPK